MANGDGSVEVRITGSLDPSLASSVRAADAQVSSLGGTTAVSAAKMSEAIKAVGGDLSKITPAMLGVGTAAGEAAGVAVPALRAAEGATASLHFATSGAIQEYIRLGHEAMQGNFSRMPGSLVVLASRMGGLQSVALATAGTFATMGVAIALPIAAHPRRSRLGLIEAPANRRRTMPTRYCASEALAPRPH